VPQPLASFLSILLTGAPHPAVYDDCSATTTLPGSQLYSVGEHVLKLSACVDLGLMQRSSLVRMAVLK
jgi:hypothetical protein